MTRRSRFARLRRIVFEVMITENQRQDRSSFADLPSLEKDCRTVIESKLPRDLSSLFDLNVETKVLETKHGSLIVFFSAMIAAYPLIASYHDFYESVHLIKKHCALLVQELVSQSYPNEFSTSVSVYHPTVPDPTDYPYRWMHKMFGYPETEMFAATAFARSGSEPSRRDLFFWYLVVMNIVLMVLIGSLVYRSVVSTYFEQPTKAIAAPSATTSTPHSRTETR